MINEIGKFLIPNFSEKIKKSKNEMNINMGEEEYGKKIELVMDKKDVMQNFIFVILADDTSLVMQYNLLYTHCSQVLIF